MTSNARLPLAAAAALVLLASGPAAAQPHTLRYEWAPAQHYVYERTQRREVVTSGAERSQRTVLESPMQHEYFVMDLQEDPQAARLVALTTPRGERLVAYEENGKDMLAEIPEDRRVRKSMPSLAMRIVNVHGLSTGGRPAAAHPLLAMDPLFMRLAELPEREVSVGDAWAEEIDFGAIKAAVSTKAADERDVDGTACLVLQSAVTVTVGAEWAEKIAVTDVSVERTVALDGRGLVRYAGAATTSEKGDGSERRTSHEFEERLKERTTIAPEAFATMKADVAELQAAIELASEKKLDAALSALHRYVESRPDGVWTPAVRNLGASLQRQRMLALPLPAEALRVVLRDLQTNHDRAASEGNVAAARQVDNIIRRVVQINLDALITDSNDADPIVRELAAFGLAFADGANAQGRLVELTRDLSAQVKRAAVLGLAIQGRGLDPERMVSLLTDPDPRVRGAGAYLASRTVKRGDPLVAQLLPILLKSVGEPADWARQNVVIAIANLAASGDTDSVRTLVDAYAKEPQEAMKPLYLAALGQITGVQEDNIGAYEAWLKENAAEAVPDAAEEAPAPEGRPKG